MRPVPPRQPLVVLALTALAACAGCSRGGSRAKSAFVERLELRAATSEPGPRSSSLVARVEIPEGPFDWAVKAREHGVVGSDELGRRGLYLRSDDTIRVDVPLPPEARGFNQVVVELVAHGRRNVALIPRLASGRYLERTGALFVREKGPSRLTFEVPELRAADGDVEALGVAFTGPDSDVTLVALELRLLPWPAWLPDPSAPAQGVRIGGELRRAKGLSDARPLGTTFTARAGAELSFAFGTPQRLRARDQSRTLELTLTGAEGRVVRERYELGADLAEPAAWHDVRIPVGDFAGQQVSAGFELSGAGAGEAVCAVTEPRLAVRAEGAPTVVLVTSDTHRADHLGAARSGVDVATPFLDSLAARGVLFEDCVASTNITNPSHVALMTATSPRDTGIVDNFTPLADAAHTLAEVFRDAGYATCAMVSVRQLGDEVSGLGQGFDRMTGPVSGQRDSRDTRRDARGPLADSVGLPLFVWLHVYDAHAPYAPPDDYKRRYYPDSEDPYDRALPRPENHAVPKWDPTVRDLGYVRALYRSEVTYVDDQLRAFLADERFQDAIVAVTADHGESLDEHGIYWDHKELYPQTLDVPLILVWPGAPAGKRVSRPVNQIDVGRTLLDLAGLAHVDFPGRNLLEEPETAGGPRFALSAHAKSASIELGRWFLVLHLRAHAYSDRLPQRELHEVELFDLENDRACETNVVDAHPDETRRLRALLVEWLLSARAEGWAAPSATQSAEAMAELRELGYTDFNTASLTNDWFDAGCKCARCAKYE